MAAWGSTAIASKPGPVVKGAWVPSPLLVGLATVPLLLACVTLIDPSMLWVMLIADGAIAALAWSDARTVRGCPVRIERTCAEVFSLGRRHPVRLQLHSHSATPLRVWVNDDVFEHAESDGLPGCVDLPPRGSTTFEYGVVPQVRGEHILGDHHIRYRSPLGLWRRQLELSARTPVRVYPDVQFIRTYERLSGQDRGSSIVKTTRQHGGQTEFEQLRDYTTGDAFRSIDWKATARRRKLVSRKYQVERDQTLLLVLDTGRLLTAQVGGLSLFDHGLNASLMLSHVATRGGDRVGLFAFDGEIRRFVPPVTGSRAMQQIVLSTFDLHPRLVASDFEPHLAWLGQRNRKRSLMILFTAVDDPLAAQELVRMTRQLLLRHLPLVVMFRDVDVEALVTEPGIDGYTRGAAAEMMSWRDQIIAQLRGAGVRVIDVRPGELTPRLLGAYAEIKARHLL